jgi:hypothetical protein
VTLQDLGNIGEFVAAIATLATLGYLAVQIRHNTKTVRTSTYQAVLDSNMRSADPILFNPDVERVYRIGRRDPSQLTADERPLFRQFVARLLLNYEAIYLQHQHGIVDSDYWRGRRSALQRLASQPGVRAVLAQGAGEAYVTGFRELLDSFLAKTEAEDGPAA